jgi:hypothetical protein
MGVGGGRTAKPTDLFSPGPPSSSSHNSHTWIASPECVPSEKNASASSCGVLVFNPEVKLSLTFASSAWPLGAGLLGSFRPVGIAFEREEARVIAVALSDERLMGSALGGRVYVVWGGTVCLSRVGVELLWEEGGKG